MPGDDWKLTINVNVPYDLFVSEEKGHNSNPNPFNYDIAFKDMPAGRNFSLHASNLKYNHGFVMLIKMHAWDYVTNQPNPSYNFTYVVSNSRSQASS